MSGRPADDPAGARGRLLGIGLGPGDPELVTLKAARLLAAVPVVAWFCYRVLELKDLARGATPAPSPTPWCGAIAPSCRWSIP